MPICKRDLTPIAAKVAGYVRALPKDFERVRAGQVLYVLDARPYEAEVERGPPLRHRGRAGSGPMGSAGAVG